MSFFKQRRCTALVLLIPMFFVFYSGYRITQSTACVINYTKPYILLYFKNPSIAALDRKFYFIKAENVSLVSFNRAIKTYDDIKPGVLINIEIEDNHAIVINDLLDPSILEIKNVEKISTFGLTSNDLLNEGIEKLKAYGFECKNGRVLPVLSIY